MSRSGTCQDALRSVVEFQRAAAHSWREEKSAGHGDAVDVVKEDRHGSGRRFAERYKEKKRKKKGRREARKKERKFSSGEESSDLNDSDSDDEERRLADRKRKKKKARGLKSRKNERKFSSGDDSSDLNDSDSDDEERRVAERKQKQKKKARGLGSRKERKFSSGDESSDLNDDDDDHDHLAGEKRRAVRKKGREERRKKERKFSSKGESSDLDDRDEEQDHRSEENGRAERKERRRKDRRESRKKERRSGEGNQKESARKRERKKQEHRPGKVGSSEDDSFPSKTKDGDDSAAVRAAEQVAIDIVGEFPDVENDLHQLLQTVDSGQAVDVSSLPNRRLVVLLEELFQSLSLKKSKAGAYVLPSGSQPIFERLSWSSICRKKEDSEANPQSHPGVGAPTVSLRGEEENLENKKRRVIGPAMPSAEILEAAARLTEAEAALRDAEAELENDAMIGPPPPAAVAEAESANDAERFEEVTRLTAADVGDAYELLGVKQGVSAADLKKRYWKLSLLVHPDKCHHPLAHQAFMALNKSFKDLQDPLKRSEIDRKVNEKLAKEENEADQKAQLQAAQWRKLRGEEALPGDAELLRGDVKDPGRDEWMTKLPPEREAGGPPSQQNTFFSRTEKTGRGDTSAWTDTPLEKAERAKMQYLEAYKQATITDPVFEKEKIEKEKSAKSAAFFDEYTEKKRGLSLVGEHQKKTHLVLKKAKKEKGKCQEEKKKEWAEAHPWKPWDREKDLTAGRQAVKLDQKSATESLASRFGSSGQRSFL